MTEFDAAYQGLIRRLLTTELVQTVAEAVRIVQGYARLVGDMAGGQGLLASG